MPPLEPVAGVARVVYSGSLGATNWANILHIQKFSVNPPILGTDAFTQDQIDDLADVMQALWVSRFRALVSTGCTLTSTTATDLSSDTGVVGADLTNSAGLISGSIPANCSCCVSWRAAEHYRGGHPRTYLPPPSSSQTVSSNLWTTAYQSQVETAMNAFLADLEADTTVTANGLALVSLHRTRNYATLLPPITRVITSALVDQRIDSQRRRLGPDL